MHIVMVTYPTPDDPEAFKDYYVKTHVPLASALPGLRSFSYGFPQSMGAANVPFCVWRAVFDDEAAMMLALKSAQGKKVGADVANYSPKGATMMHFPVVQGP
ncbi:MAG: EthD family reductase [Myxococcota bacterium]